MAISYPLTMPSSPAPAEAEIYIDRNQTKIYSFSKLLHVQRNPGDRWIGKISLPLLTPDQAAEWLGFFDALDGYVGRFRMPHPDFSGIRGSAGDAEGRVAGAGQLGGTLVTDGWGANVTGLFRAGDMIEIGGKLKRVVADVNSNAGGVATLNIAPNFYSAPANNLVVRTNNPAGTFRLSDGFVQPTSDALRRHRISFAVEEVLP